MRLTAIGFDADDTLWHNERFFRQAHDRFEALMAPYAPSTALQARLEAAERRNLEIYGYGVKGFTLSVIETALELSNGQIPGQAIAELLATGREMLAHPVELLPHARAAIEALAGRYRLVLITKGDLLDQERKLARSGLGDLFDAVEIVSHKTAAIYTGIFAPSGGPERALMAGNSLFSDVLPMLEAGGWGVHVPHELTWALEHAPLPQGHPRFAQIADLGALPELIERLESH